MLALNTQEIDDAQIPRNFEQASAGEVLRWAFKNFSSNIALACSFQAESSVLIDMLYQLRGTDFRVFTLDTGRLNQETYDCMEALRQRYGIAIEVYFPAAGEVEQMVKAHGLNLFYESIDLRKRCCAVRKVEPLKRALNGLAAWVTGLRREQTVTRTALEKVERDEGHGGILKINPLADWTHKQVWDYIAAHEVPYNKLHDRGFPSIGCAPCTRAIKPWEESRAGRWWWEKAEQKECGLHV
ncbi:MAG: phosphoadenylyl-sulfate reductase [Chloroflexota bacterium]